MKLRIQLLHQGEDEPNRPVREHRIHPARVGRTEVPPPHVVAVGPEDDRPGVGVPQRREVVAPEFVDVILLDERQDPIPVVKPPPRCWPGGSGVA